MRMMRMRKTPSKKEKLKPKLEIKPIFAYLDLSYLSSLGYNTLGLPNPTKVQVFPDNTIKIINNGESKELW